MPQLGLRLRLGRLGLPLSHPRLALLAPGLGGVLSRAVRGRQLHYAPLSPDTLP